MTAASSSRSPWLSASRLYIIFHQVLFLVTGLITTLGVQWLFYTGAASRWMDRLGRLNSATHSADEHTLSW